MSAPAQVTEAHLELAKNALFSRDKAGRLLTAPMAAQLIADSEARAVAEWQDSAHLKGAAIDSLLLECDRLRADVERLTAELEQESKWKAREYLARAERAEAEVAASMQAGGFAYFTAQRDDAERRAHNAEYVAKKAQAELKAEQDNSAINEIELRVSRAIVSKIWVQLGSPTYEQLKGRSIYDLIDELKAELAKERARLDWLMAGGVCMVQHTGGFRVSRLHAPVSRAAIDAAMKEETK